MDASELLKDERIREGLRMAITLLEVEMTGDRWEWAATGDNGRWDYQSEYAAGVRAIALLLNEYAKNQTDDWRTLTDDERAQLLAAL